MFYLKKRDGFARIGHIELKSFKIETPCIVELGSEFVRKLDFGKAAYPVKYFCEEVYEKLKSTEKDIRILTGLSALGPRNLVNVFSEVGNFRPLYAVAAATPYTVPILIYLGVDILDNILAISKACEGIYFLNEGEVELSKLKELPCNCEVCRKYGIDLKDLDFREKCEALAKHNTQILRNIVEFCKILIEKEELRNYVEARAKLKPDLTVILRLSESLDDSLFSRFKKSTCYFNTLESFSRFEVRYFLNRALECYAPECDVVLILPCTAKKPYLTSKTHRKIRESVKIGVNEIIVSSPLVVPREFELVYPAVNYDTPVTGHWSNEEIDFVASWLRKFIEKGEFEKVVAHVEGGYKKVVERALKDYEVVYTAEDGILSSQSLERLKREVEGQSYRLYEHIFEHMFRYQFGCVVAGRVRGRYPKIELFNRSVVSRVDLNYGMLDIYRDVAEKFVKEKIYSVKIDDFEPSTTIFAAGVIDACENIRPNDVVVFYNNEIFGVGLAVMSGREMVECEKGVAVKVRRKWRF